MPYCVKCGVELGKSEKVCPLCGIETCNPELHKDEPVEHPYPKYVETFMKRIDKRYFATLIGLFLAIPIAITILFDIISGEGITWSAYVVGALILLYIFAAVPLYFRRYHTVIFLSANCAAVLLYLLFIETMNGGNWFLIIGMPVTLCASVLIIALALVFTKKKPGLFIRIALIFISLGLFLLSVELILSYGSVGAFMLNWSYYAFVPCFILAVIALVFERRKKLKERIRRRLFY